jgi:UDP-N-acetylmuramyl pentapeptide synthase
VYNTIMADNKVFLRDDNVIEILVVGDQNAASIEMMGRQISVLLTKLRGQGKPCLVLDDLLQMGEVNSEGRKLVVDLAKRMDFDKLAMVGKGGLLHLGANLMLHATGRADKVRYFEDRDVALNWLKG